MRGSILLIGALFVGCEGSSYDYAGHNTYEYFALDGQRTWKYRQDDLSIEWRMEVTKTSTEDRNGTEVVTLDYSVLDPAELLYSIEWSSDSSDGILIHGYRIEEGYSASFTEPMIVAEYRMNPGDVVESVADGVTYTSTLVGVETCENDWVVDPWDCLHFSISDGVDGEGSAPFVGDWWFAADWGTSRFQPVDYSSNWILSEALWSPDDD